MASVTSNLILLVMKISHKINKDPPKDIANAIMTDIRRHHIERAIVKSFFFLGMMLNWKMNKYIENLSRVSCVC